MTPGRLLYLLKRAKSRGFRVSWAEYRVAPRIRRWSVPHSQREPEPVPVHLVGGAEHILMTGWALLSWFENTGRNWRVVFHDDGSCTQADFDTLRAFLPTMKIIARSEGDRLMEEALSKAPRCLDYRRRMPHGIKSFDAGLLSESADGRYILLDPDVLFYRKPEAILRWVDAPADSEEARAHWFNEDVQEPSPFEFPQVNELLGFPFWPKVNSGLCLLSKRVVDLAFFEDCLALEPMQRCKDWRVEQTLLALGASRLEAGGLLPAEYEISLGERCETEAISRHYIGAVRDHFWGEGVLRLAQQYLPS